VGRAILGATIKEILALPSERKRAICNDDISGHSLDTIEVAKILTATTPGDRSPARPARHGRLPDERGRRALEVRDLAQVLVCSEELEPADGWAYHALLIEMAENPQMDGGELGRLWLPGRGA